MKEIRMKEALGLVKTWGRTYWDEQEGVLYSNYTCGAFELEFQGRELAVEFSAVPDTFVPPNLAGEQPPREDWPFISVFLDGSETPRRRVQVRDGERVSVFRGDGEERRRVRIVKLNENFRTCLGIRAFYTDGTLLPFEKERRDVIEFIGDSITCGFGNDTQDVSHEYAAAEQDGWMTHGADYYLYDKIAMIVEKLRKETGDRRLFLLKYNKMMNMGPDAGGCLHPTVYRHRLMAEDLVKKIRSIQEKGM